MVLRDLGSFVVDRCLVLKLGRRASEHVVWNIIFRTFSQNGVRGAHVNQKQLLSLSSVFKERGLVVSWWH